MENTNPKIAIIGYGSMGKEIERIAKEQGIEVTDIFELDSKLDVTKSYDFDVAIDFSFPDQVMENLKAVTALKKDLVLGTTGWYDRKEEVAKLVLLIGVVLLPPPPVVVVSWWCQRMLHDVHPFLSFFHYVSWV